MEYGKIIGVFESAGLKEFDGCRLQNRAERKFLLTGELFPQMVEHLSSDYLLLSINGKYGQHYLTEYFDTPDYFFYLQHHNRKLNRHKLRIRTYCDTGERFFEIKFKNNKKTTEKYRNRTNGSDNDCIPEDSYGFLRKKLPEQMHGILCELKRKLTVEYDRLTLRDKSGKERITFDFNLQFADCSGNRALIRDLIIAEQKAPEFSQESIFCRKIRSFRAQHSGFSKYCMGTAMLNNQVKRNDFKDKLRKIRIFSEII